MKAILLRNSGKCAYACNRKEKVRKRYRSVLRSLVRLRSYLARHLTLTARFVLLSFTIGIVAGLAAFLLKYLVKHLSSALLSTITLPGANWLLLVYPAAGIMFTYMICRFLMRRNLENGTQRIKLALSARHYYMAPPLCFESILASTVTLGFGGSAGAEAPIAYSGAAIGSNIGRIFGLTPTHMKAAMSIGAGAGIAAIFISPIGGALFSLEVLQVQLSSLGVLSLVLACIVAAMTCYWGTGFNFDVDFTASNAFDPTHTGWVILLGVCCGIYSIYYSALKNYGDQLLKRIRSGWIKAAASGIFLSLVIFLLPSLYGDGYGVLANAINDQPVTTLIHSPLHTLAESHTWLPIAAIGIILLLKGIMVSATVSGGGVAGEFAPTLFAGALAGYLFAYIVNTFFGGDLPVQNFALIGMAAVMAGVIHAPLMAMFITVEMSCGYVYMLGVFLATFISYIIVKLVTPNSVWRSAVHDDVAAMKKYRSSDISTDTDADTVTGIRHKKQ